MHPGGYLLVVKKSDGAVFKVPLATPQAFTRVAMTGSVEGGDGLWLTDPRRLLVVANRIPKVATDAALVLSSDDDRDPPSSDAPSRWGTSTPRRPPCGTAESSCCTPSSTC